LDLDRAMRGVVSLIIISMNTQGIVASNDLVRKRRGRTRRLLALNA